MSTAPRDDLPDCDIGGASVRTLHQLADPSRSCDRAELTEYRQP